MRDGRANEHLLFVICSSTDLSHKAGEDFYRRVELAILRKLLVIRRAVACAGNSWMLRAPKVTRRGLLRCGEIGPAYPAYHFSPMSVFENS